MSAHTVKHFQTSEGIYGRCACGRRMPEVGTVASTQEVEDLSMAHDRVVESARAGLRSRTPSLKSQRDYYREKANDLSEPAGSRLLWGGLADQLDHRLNDQHQDPDAQPALF